MTKKREVYHCDVCGNMVEIINNGAAMSCCGKVMSLLQAQHAEEMFEKHLPAVEVIDGGYMVRIGSTVHPMLKEHHIQWIELLTEHYVMRKELLPNEEPTATFYTAEKAVEVREYCNIHGLFSKKMP